MALLCTYGSMPGVHVCMIWSDGGIGVVGLDTTG